MTQSMTLDARARVVAPEDGLTARFRKGWANYRLYRATLHELGQLSDRELADLGLHRASIADIARQSVYGA